MGYALLVGLSAAGVIDTVLQTVLQTIFINIILAVSLNLIIGITGQFSLGHAGFMCVGAYCAGILISQIGGVTGLFAGILVGMVINAILALIVAIPTLRLRGDYLAIATLGFGEIIRIIVLNMEITNGAAGLVIPKVVSLPVMYILLVLSIIASSPVKLSIAVLIISARQDGAKTATPVNFPSNGSASSSFSHISYIILCVPLSMIFSLRSTKSIPVELKDVVLSPSCAEYIDPRE